MKKSVKIISILLMTLVVITTISADVSAADDVLTRLEEETDSAQVDTAEIETTAGKVIKIMQTIGIIVGVAVLVILGIKFMMGSAEEKAEYKKTFIPLIIGAIVLISAFSLASFLFSALGE